MIEFVKPNEIESRSFEIIESELKFPLDEKIAPIVKRVIHTSADFDYAENMAFSENVVDIAIDALKSGVHILTDTQMARAGINKATLKLLNSEVHCFIADDDVANAAKEQGTTRSAASMQKAASHIEKPLIIAVGNAPTALIELEKLIRDGKISPVLIIGAPVGFVNVVESKDLIMGSGVPFIVAKGRKGGSNVAAAIVNALLYLAKPRVD